MNSLEGDFYLVVEPLHAGDPQPTYTLYTRSAAISLSRASTTLADARTDEQALEDFIIVHWAEHVHATIMPTIAHGRK